MKLKSNHPGFSLVEILLYLLVVFALVIALLSASGALSQTRSSNLKMTAVNIASCDIEKTRLSSFPPVTSTTPSPPCDLDMANLPQSSFNRAVADAPNAPGDPNIKKVTAIVNWQDGNNAASTSIETLISTYGLK